MGKYEKLLSSILMGESKNINFEELRGLLLKLGFHERIKGSHHIFFAKNMEEIINIQPDGSKAKSYQVNQIRALIIKYNLH